MRTIIYFLCITALSIFLFTGYFIQSGELLANEKPNTTECPYLEGKTNNSSSACPYLNGELKCPYTGNETKTESCPYLKENGNGKKIYKTIQNSSI